MYPKTHVVTFQVHSRAGTYSCENLLHERDPVTRCCDHVVEVSDKQSTDKALRQGL